MNNLKSVRKSVFEYDNYRNYLRDFYEHSKLENKNFSLGYFSRLAGFKSRSVLRQVMAGERNIAPGSIAKFIKALKLGKEQALFFQNLVLLNQASSADEKLRFTEEIMKIKKYRQSNPLSESQLNYFSHWYYVAIREMAYMPGFRNDPVWIASKLKPSIKVSEARRAVEELIRLGFLIAAVNGGLTPSDGWLATADEVTSPALVLYHQAMISRASESIARFTREKRDISAQTFAVSRETAKSIKEKIQAFRKEIEDIASRDSIRDTVYQLNFQLFPIADVADE
jgi:uncharacterized protein (TIGR02147 family)